MSSKSGVLKVISFFSLSGKSNHVVLLTVTLYSVAHSQCVVGMNSIIFPEVQLHFQLIFGVISIGQGRLSLLFRLVRGIRGILNNTIRF